MSSRRVESGAAVQPDLFGHPPPAPPPRALPTPAPRSTPPDPTRAPNPGAPRQAPGRSAFAAIVPAAEPGPRRLTVTDGGRRLDALFERSARAKHTSIRVDPMAQTVVVVAPLLEPMASVERFVRDRIAWALSALRGLATSRAADVIDIEHAGETLTIAYEPNARARRVSLRVDARTGNVKLVVPPRLSKAQALDFARQHAGWIAARLKRRLAPIPFAAGAVIPVFDVPHLIRHRPEARGTAWLEDGELHVAGDAAHLARRVGDWLTARLRATLAPLAHDKAARIAKPVGHISLRDTVSQWGSCAPDGDLCFSLRLALAPHDVVDYVVAHEIAHLVHRNHSARFWKLTQELSAADMTASRAWLRQHGPSLMRYG